MSGNKEVLIISTTAERISEALHRFQGVRAAGIPRLEWGQTMAASQRFDAIYIEDSTGTIPAIWDMIREIQATQQRVVLLLGIFGPGVSHIPDFQDSNIPVITQHEPALIARWLAEHLGLRARAGARQIEIAVAGAKGGIGKTLVTALLAEGMTRRDLNVLVIDGDVSNSGLRPTFRIPPGARNYIEIIQEGRAAWTPERLQEVITHHPSGIDFLLGSEDTADPTDMTPPTWEAMMQAVRSIGRYDVVLLDTGPEMKKRPYALITARDGGMVVLPTPPGNKERTGVGNALHAFQHGLPGRDLSDRCFLLYMEPERGAVVRVDHVRERFKARFPRVRELGVLPRAARQVSIADEEQGRYLCPLDVAPHSRFSRAVYELVEVLCRETNLQTRKPMPRSTWWQRLRGERPVLPLRTNDDDGPSVGAAPLTARD